MALAKQCDRCGQLYQQTITPDIRINKYVHPYGDSWIDLCPDCQKQLEMWLKGECTVVVSFDKKEKNNG